MRRLNGPAVTGVCFLCLTVILLVLYTQDIPTDALYKSLDGFGLFQDPISPERYFSISSDEDPYKETEFNFTELQKPESAKERFHLRSQHLQRICKKEEKFGSWSGEEAERYKREWVRNDNFVIVADRSFLVCVLPKCGSTSWHWLARDMHDPLSAGHMFGWQDRQKNTEISQELDPAIGLRILNDQNAFIAIAVRHPFAKMISGWNDKLASDGTYGAFVLEAYPHMQKYKSDDDAKHVITFEALAEYIAAYGEDEGNLDYHFMPMQSLCLPCLYPYNYIVKLETLSADEKWIKQSLNIKKMPWEQKGSVYFSADQSNPVEIIRSYFKKVKKSTIKKLMNLYYYDFALFGYTFNVDTLTAGGFI